MAAHRLQIRQRHIAETNDALRIFGEHGCEGLVLWLGRMSAGQAMVEECYLPPQQPIRSEAGVGYFVTGETLFALNRYLADTGLRLLAQVHSHPGRAYHSAADDEYAIVTKEGGFSLVVPNFGAGPADIREWAVYQLFKASWTRLSEAQVTTALPVVAT